MTSPPAKIGKYEVLGVIGRGGMGVVYMARDPQLNRPVAIKMIVGATPGLVKRFDVEARSTASLQHPNIVTIYDFGDQGGSPYLVMEYLEGVSLESVLRSENDKLSLASKLNICIEVCNGLNYAHERGIIHRDIKPANIMLLKDGSVKIVDFGIARIGDTGISRTEIVGTIQYMSPEQFQNQPLDRRTDIYSTGVVLYQLLTGVVPFQATGEASIMYQIIHDEPPPLGSHLQAYPAELDGILAKALTKDRDLRYPTGREFAFDLIAVAEKQKQFEVTQWLNRADAAVQRTEWSKAEDYLRRVLSIDGRHTQAHQLLNNVQQKIRQQRQVEQVRQLRGHADQAFLERRYEDALAILDEAIGLDKTSQDLSRLREAIVEAKSRAAQFKFALRKAEEAQQAGEFAEAKQAVQQALEIEPQDTSAKAMLVVIARKAEELSRQQRFRALMESARDHLAARDLTNAFKALKEAERIDPTSPELSSLLTVVNTARDEQLRRVELDRLAHEIDGALKREDHAAAISLANEGLKRNPNEPGLLKLKSLAEAELRAIQLKAYVREQSLVAGSLLEAGRTVEALSAIEKALRNAPGDMQLETLRTVARSRLATDEEEDRKREMLLRAQELAASNKHQEATQILEHVREEFAGTREIDSLLEDSRAAQRQAESLERARKEAQQLLSQGSLEAAVQYLEKRTLEIPSPQLFDLLENARGQLQHFQTELKTAIREGNRILRENGAGSAAKYLHAQPEKYWQRREFKALTAAVQKHLEAEALDRDLAGTPEPDAKIRLAENALRKNPENDEVKKRLASVRAFKDQITEILEKARVLEASMRYAEAASQLRRLGQLHSSSGLDVEIGRLERLEKESTEQKSKPPYHEARLENEFHATSVLTPGLLEQPGTKQIEPRTDSYEESVPPPASSSAQRRTILIPMIAFAIAVICVALYVPLSKRSKPGGKRATDSELALQSESDRLKANRNFDEAMNVDRTLQGVGGVLSDWAAKDLDHITELLRNERSLMDQAKAAEDAKQWELAIQKYQSVINLHGRAEASAAVAIEDLKLKRSGANGNQIADQGLRRGVNAFDRKDYLLAQKAFEAVLRAAPQDWPRRSEARDFLTKNQHRYEQSGLLNDAEREFGAKHYDLAKKLAGEVSDYPDGAPDISRKGKELARETLDRLQQQSVFDEAVKQESTNPTLAESSFKKVIDLPGGDPDLARRANEQLVKLAKTASAETSDTLIAAIQSSIKVGNFDAAEEKLRTLNPSDPNYQRVRQSIDDAVFAKRVNEAEIAMRAPETPDRQATLRSLLAYFQAAAKLSNRNSRLASRYTQDIDALLSPPRPPPAENGTGSVRPVISAVDKAAIQALLSHYADILNRRRAKDLREVWPEIPKLQFDKYQAFIENHKKLSVSISPEKWDAHGTGFLVTCQQILAFEHDGKLETHPDAINFYVVKIQGGWKISDIPASAQ